MTINLSAYNSIQTNIFVKIDIPSYQVLTFSDYHKTLSQGGVDYTGLGQLLSITQTTSSLRATQEELTIGISGIPSNNIPDILDHKIKGSKITVSRGFFNPDTASLINFVGKFIGVVSNFSISDDLSNDTGNIVLTIVSTNIIEMLDNKITGRRTNPTDERLLYPTDASFDRIPGLARSNFNFGAST